MDARTEGKKLRRVFEVARELKVETPTIIDYLESRGYDVSRKLMHPVTEEMYLDLLRKFNKNSYIKYKADNDSTKEAQQRKQSERLRREEQDKLLAVKKTDEVSESKKIELPRFKAKIIKDASAKTDDPKTETEPTVVKDTAKPAEIEPLVKEEKPVESQKPITPTVVEKVEATTEIGKVEVGKQQPKVVEDKKSVDRTESEKIQSKEDQKKSASQPGKKQQPKGKRDFDHKKRRDIPRQEKQVQPVKSEPPKKELEKVPEPVVEPEVTPVVEAKPVPRKYELPKARSLKIIQQAPDKEEEKRRRAEQQLAAQKKAQEEKAARGKADKEKSEKAERSEKAGAHAKPKTGKQQQEKKAGAKPAHDGDAVKAGLAGEAKPKRKLKRKRIAIAVETPEDEVTKEHEQKLTRELVKRAKQKVGVKSEAVQPSKPLKGGKKKHIPVPKEARDPKQKRSRKRQKVSATEVAATIKATMAKVEGRGKKTKRHVHSSSDGGAEIETTVLQVTEFITTQELANLLEVSFQEIIQRCLSMGMIITINQRLDRDMIELLADEFDTEVEFVKDEELEDEPVVEIAENLEKRPPVVTVMGHVDHGKTTLLDNLRRAHVAAGEAGGITQHIGAYEVVFQDQRITFLDTPGHEAFTAMRARGAQITDIVVLVVAADDRVMPQTLEAIDHARAAGTPIIVAVNKVDKPSADPEKIYKELAEHNILVEKWGGTYQSTEISAKFGQGVDDLLGEILVAAEILDLKADPTVKARGVVVESQLDKGLGVLCTVLIQMGTLHIGDPLVVGESSGKVRSMFNEKGVKREEAGPATPVQVVGFNGVPQAGDSLVVYDTEREAREVSQRRQRQHREIAAHRIRTLTLEQASRQMKEAMLQELPLLIKGDVHGSVEVLSDALMKLSTKEVKVGIIHRGVGAITESDILLAAASNAIIIGFHVHPNPQARELARREGVEIRLYRIIHEVVDEIHSSLEGLLAPTQEEEVIGALEVRQVFKISRLGSIAGSHVTEGKITKSAKVRLIRDNVEIWHGELASLKRFKDDAKEVVAGFECGVALDGYRELREGDVIQAYVIVEKQRKLEDSE